MLKLLSDPQVLQMLGVAGGLGGLLGFAVRAAVSAIRAAGKTELELAIAQLERAKITPDLADDDAARRHVDNMRRLKAVLDSLPDPRP